MLRDAAQSEEVAKEVLVEVWRTAFRHRPEPSTALNWILTLVHRRAIDRVRSVEAAAVRAKRAPLWSSRAHDKAVPVAAGMAAPPEGLPALIRPRGQDASGRADGQRPHRQTVPRASGSIDVNAGG